MKFHIVDSLLVGAGVIAVLMGILRLMVGRISWATWRDPVTLRHRRSGNAPR